MSIESRIRHDASVIGSGLIEQFRSGNELLRPTDRQSIFGSLYGFDRNPEARVELIELFENPIDPVDWTQYHVFTWPQSTVRALAGSGTPEDVDAIQRVISGIPEKLPPAAAEHAFIGDSPDVELRFAKAKALLTAAQGEKLPTEFRDRSAEEAVDLISKAPEKPASHDELWAGRDLSEYLVDAAVATSNDALLDRAMDVAINYGTKLFFGTSYC